MSAAPPPSRPPPPCGLTRQEVQYWHEHGLPVVGGLCQNLRPDRTVCDCPISAHPSEAVTAGPAMITEETLFGALAKYEKNKEGNTFVMSQASAAAVHRLLQNLDIFVKDEDIPVEATIIPTDGYDWRGKNEDDPEAFAGAFEFLKAMLISGGVQFGRDHYQLIDVHSIKSMLSFEDEKVGKLSGGTDIIITPFALSKVSYVKELCVLFELKTADRVEKEKGFSPSEPQALLELLAARCMSHQPKVLVILTDLISGAVAFTLNYDSDRNVFTVFRYPSLQVSQIAAFVSNFLANCCIPIVDFMPRADLNDPRQLQPIEFKRRRLSAAQIPPEWEQFVDIIEDPFSTDIERRMITGQLFRSFSSFREDSNDRSWLSMYI